jgi:hypothetical protein
LVDLINSRRQITEILQLRNIFSDPTSIYRRGAFDEFLRGFTTEPTQKFDQFFTEEEEEEEVFDLILIFLKLEMIKLFLFFR